MLNTNEVVDAANPIYTLIVPVKNTDSVLLSRCVNSICEQTLSCFELLIVNDSSTAHATKDVLETIEREDTRVRVISNEGKGVAAARNTGLDYSNGAYIAFVDSDDWIERDYLEVHLNEMKRTRSNTSCCSYDRPQFPGKQPLRLKAEVLDKKRTLLHFITSRSFFTSLWNKAFSRELVFRDSGEPIHFREDLSVGEDQEWLSRLYTTNTIQCVQIPDVLYHWCYNPNSITQAMVIRHDIDRRASERQALELTCERLNLYDSHTKPHTAKKLVRYNCDMVKSSYMSYGAKSEHTIIERSNTFRAMNLNRRYLNARDKVKVAVLLTITRNEVVRRLILQYRRLGARISQR